LAAATAGSTEYAEAETALAASQAKTVELERSYKEGAEAFAQLS
jgi:hypothetical protein